MFCLRRHGYGVPTEPAQDVQVRRPKERSEYRRDSRDISEYYYVVAGSALLRCWVPRPRIFYRGCSKVLEGWAYKLTFSLIGACRLVGTPRDRYTAFREELSGWSTPSLRRWWRTLSTRSAASWAFVAEPRWTSFLSTASSKEVQLSIRPPYSFALFASPIVYQLYGLCSVI